MGELTVGTFTPSLLLDLARSSGKLERAGLQVREVAVATSRDQFAALRDGSLDALVTSPDNALAYRFVSGNPLGERLDLVVPAGLDRGLGLGLYARPGWRRDASSPTVRLAVDVPASGFALVGYELLRREGLRPGDYDVVALGSTPTRARALVAGECDLTILGSGNELVAASQGCTRVAEVQTLGRYLGAVLVRLRRSPRRQAVADLTCALVETAGEIAQGARSRELAAAASRLLAMPNELAREHAAVWRDPLRGVVPDGKVARDDLLALLALRHRFAPAPELASIPAALPDLFETVE